MNARRTRQQRASAATTLAAQRRNAACAALASPIDAVGRGHGVSAERNTVSATGRPMLIL